MLAFQSDNSEREDTEVEQDEEEIMRDLDPVKEVLFLTIPSKDCRCNTTHCHYVTLNVGC